MPTTRPIWSADVPVSMPEPTGDDIVVPMFGFAMSQYRLIHDITPVEYAELRVPIFRPEYPGLTEVRGDGNVDQGVIGSET